MRTVCIVQARMGSKRLPGKVLLPLNGHTVIGEVLSRCKRIPGVDEVVCAIPEGDDWLGWQIVPFGVRIIQGPEHDVLSRYYVAACKLDLAHSDIIVRVTGDCPLISPEVCGEVIELRRRSGAEYASNIEPRTFPQGLDCEVFTMALLKQAQQVSGPHEREHVTTWMRGDNDVHRVNFRSPWLIEGRLTLDTEDDYRTICAYFGHEPYQQARAA